MAWWEKELGGLPMGVWVAVVGGALGLSFYYYSNNSSGSDAPVRVEDTSPQQNVGRESGGWQSDPPEDNSDDSGNFQTNEEWRTAAIEEMLAQNYPADLVDTAVRNYLAGRSLSDQQQSIINIVLKSLGPPPISPPPSGDNPDPENPGDGSLNAPGNVRVVSTGNNSITIAWNAVGSAAQYEVSEQSDLGSSQQTVTGTRFKKTDLVSGLQHTFTVRAINGGKKGPGASVTASTTGSGNGGGNSGGRDQQTVTVTPWPSQRSTLWGIAEEFLGSGNRWQEIFNANRNKISDPDMIYAGQVLTIPNG